MSLPGNGIFVVQGEMAMLVTAMRRSTRWGSHSFPNEEYDVLMRTFQDLKSILNQVEDLRLLDPATYLSPFLEVIRSKETTGPVTSLALSAIHKFLSYGLIDPTHPSVPATVDDIADAVTHARFVGTDHSSDGVVLMKILQVLRTLMLSPEGAMLTDESVCEIMLSCFRICFETRLTELLRRNAEQCLRDMTQLIFMRLPQFAAEDGSAAAHAPAPLSLKKRDKPSKRKLAAIQSSNSLDRKSPTEQPSAPTDTEADSEASKVDALRNNQDKNLLNEAEITIEPVDPVKSPAKKHGRHSSMDLANQNPITQLLEKCVENTDAGEEVEKVDEKEGRHSSMELASQNPITQLLEKCVENTDAGEEVEKVDEKEAVEVMDPPEAEAEAQGSTEQEAQEYVNHRGVRFTPEDTPQPYGLSCVRELFRFLISLCNPLEGGNTSAMVHLGLSLVGVALEVACDQLPRHAALLLLARDPLCRHLHSLLSTERISIFALNLQVSFLLFESLRFHLKFQMEAFFKKLIEIISADTTKAIYELKEIHHLALESLAQMFRIPGLCTELYLNYDCDVYCTNIFEELTKLLSKNVVSSTAYNIHTLSLEALMTIIEAIETANQISQKEVKSETEIANLEEEKEMKYGRSGHVSLELGGMDDASVLSDQVTHDISQCYSTGTIGRHKVTCDIPTEAELDNIRNKKKWVQQGTELFNQKPEKGIEYLQEHGVLASPLDPREVAAFLRENPDLDKKMIGEYICKRSARTTSEDDDGHSVLGAFAESFDFTGLRIDQALRLYLETFRLPGEAPLIFLVMERFAERWHSTNGEPFANTDAAFRLAYAVIMLNVDQHNQNAKKVSTPMTMQGFVRNLRGCNGAGDFLQPMLEEIFHAIKNEEMVMPAERVGPVRDAYLWRVLQRRGNTPAGRYRAAPATHPHRARLFAHACPPTVTALSAAFERASPPTSEEIESNNMRDSPALVALNGLERCAALISRLPPIELTLDTLLLTLCKFTGLLAPQHANYIAIGVTLGQSAKAQLALRRACAVAARHADCVRDAWRHLLEIVKTLFIGRLLPKSLIEVEDYLAPSGRVSLIQDSPRGAEAGLLSSIYSYIALGETGMRAPTPHERALIEAATECVQRCNLPGLLITETKFLQLESLQELVRAMVAAGTPPDSDSLQLEPQLEHMTVFFLELLGQTLIQNRDRLLTVWDVCGPHLHRCVSWCSARPYALLRTLTAVVRTSARLMRCASCAPAPLALLPALLTVHVDHQPTIRGLACGLYELVKTSAQNVHSTEEWNIIFSLLCAVGAGAWPRANNNNSVGSASSRSEGSEDESDRRPTSISSESELSHSPQTQGWILVKTESRPDPLSLSLESVVLRPVSRAALARCCEALALVVRDVAHVTPYNCRAAVTAVRIFAKATLRSSKKNKSRSGRSSRSSGRRRASDSSDSDSDNLDQLQLVSIQLLDLMHTLHSRTQQIFKWWKDEAEGQGGEDYDLWEVAWKPLLQGIAQFCTDKRKQVANSAIAYLQRALLVPGMSSMSGSRWEACFQSVLFPLLEQLPHRPDTAQRANTIMCKVFLQHLSALSSRATFGALWIKVVEVQNTLIAASSDDPLTEAALESLKNMILVMDSVRIFSNGDGYNDLWYITWDKIAEFLPSLKEELFPQVQDNARPPTSLPSHMQPSLPPSLPTLIPVGPNSTPTLLPPQPSLAQQPPTVAQQAPMAGQQPPIPGLGLSAHSPVNISQTPPLMTSSPALVAPTPISGMVPIRNPLYDQTGLTSSVLLQPLNEMISTPIGLSIQSQMPVLYPQNDVIRPIQPTPQESRPTVVDEASSPQQSPLHQNAPQMHQSAPQMHQDAPKMHQNAPLMHQEQPQPTIVDQPASPHKNTILEIVDNISIIDPKIEQSELYADYLTDPYNEHKDISKEATLYDPTKPGSEITNPLLSALEKHKSLSEHTTPMHKNKTQFGSSDNVRQESSIFNFSSYFGSTELGGSEVFDTLMSTQEG